MRILQVFSLCLLSYNTFCLKNVIRMCSKQPYVSPSLIILLKMCSSSPEKPLKYVQIFVLGRKVSRFRRHCREMESKTLQCFLLIFPKAIFDNFWVPILLKYVFYWFSLQFANVEISRYIILQLYQTIWTTKIFCDFNPTEEDCDASPLSFFLQIQV